MKDDNSQSQTMTNRDLEAQVHLRRVGLFLTGTQRRTCIVLNPLHI
jgi:hypothetical protein